MFTIRCTTCNAKLAVKNEALIGQILACPKCESMVLVERPSEEPFDSGVSPPEEMTPPMKYFPDLTAETDSGLIHVDSDGKPAANVPVSPPPAPIPLSDKELRTRKFMLGLLVGLLVALILSIGILIAVQGNRQNRVADKTPSSETVPEKTISMPENDAKTQDEPTARSEEIVVTPATPKEVPEPETAPETAPETMPEMEAETSDDPPEAPSTPESERTEPSDDRPTTTIRVTTDLLSDLEKKLPGLVEPSAMLTIDIPARLRQPLAGLSLNRTPLLVVVRTFSALTEIPTTLDIDEFSCRGIRVDEPITGPFKSGTVGNLLSEILAPLGLEAVIEDRQLLITVPPERRDALAERTFDVADLIEKTKEAVDLRGKTIPDGPLTPERLLDMVRRLVDPIEWTEAPGDEPNDGKPTIRIDGNTLTVRHRHRMLDRTLRILEQLRVLRRLPQTTEVVGEHLVPEAFGWDAVDAPITLNYYQPAPLSDILEQLETTTKLHILVDHKALHRALTPLNTIRGTVQCDRGTVNEALERLLGSVDAALLCYRIIDVDLLEITTRDVARQPDKMSIEIHRYETPEALLPDDRSPEELVRTIRTVLEPGSWCMPDRPETVGRGDIVVDLPSGCLIVRQSQPIQRQLRLWLRNDRSDR